MDNSVGMMMVCLVLILVISSWQGFLLALLVTGVGALAYLQYREAKYGKRHKHDMQYEDFENGSLYWKCSGCDYRSMN